MFIFVLCVAGYYFYTNNFSGGSSITMGGDDHFVIESGDHTFVAEVVSDYEEHLTIYGINDNDSNGWSPMAYANYLLVARPYVGEISECQKNLAQTAPMMCAIVNDDAVEGAISQLAMSTGQTDATIIGKKLNITEFTYRGEDHSDSLQKIGKLDPAKAILIEDIIVE